MYSLGPGERTNGTFDQIVELADQSIEVTVKDSTRETKQKVFLTGQEIHNFIVTSDPADHDIDPADDRNMILYFGQSKKSTDGRVILQITNAAFENATLYAFNDDDCVDKLMMDENDSCGKRLEDFPPMTTSSDLIENSVMDNHIELMQDVWGFLGKFSSGRTCVMNVSQVGDQ